MKYVSSYDGAMPDGLLDIDFFGRWTALGFVMTDTPATIILKDGDIEVARGRAETPHRDGGYSFRFEIQRCSQDRVQGFISETGAEIPRRRDYDD